MRLLPTSTLPALPSRRMLSPATHPAGPAASAADAAVWHVRVLGGFELDDGRQCLTRLRSRAAMALVARLAMAPTRAHARTELAALLWPDADEEAGRSRLRQTLSLLRSVLEPPGGAPVFEADRRFVKAVAGALWCDALAFEQALRARQTDLAQALYRGELLPGFYDEWVVDERERLQALVDRAGVDALGPLPAAAGLSPAAVAAAPAAAGVRVPRPRLPQYLTRLVGADLSGARLRALVAQQRLVAVLGPGGSGKTRLAVEVARLLGEDAAAQRFEPPVFVSLVGVEQAADTLDRLCMALHLQAAGDPTERLLGALDGRRLLLVLDNAEQLDDGAVAALAHLVERLPRVHWLVTSRRPLGIDGEHAFVLEHLPLPALEAPLAEVASSPAVQLFIDRARAHRADFAVSAGNRGALVALVRWLEGLPLAIELAASHARTLGPAELLALLRGAREDRDDPAAGLSFLARRGARSGSDPRHASMLDVIAWSWRLLAPPAQHLLGRLALLPGGATLHAAAALGSATGRLNLARAQAELDMLVAHSVVRVVAGRDGQMRYAPFEPVREYALAAQDAAAHSAGRAAVRLWLAQWARALPATTPLDTVRDELPNLMVAIATAVDDGAGNASLSLVLTLASAWSSIAVPASVLAALDRLLDAPGLDDSLAAGCHALLARSFHEVGQPDAVRRHARAALARPCPDEAVRASVLSRCASVAWRLDRDGPGALALIDDGLAAARRSKRVSAEAALLSLQGYLVARLDGDAVRGGELTRRAAELWGASGNRHMVCAGRYNVAYSACSEGRNAEMLGELQALADEARTLANWDLAASALDLLGSALMRLRRWQAALQAQREALALAWDSGQIVAATFALRHMAPALARTGHIALALRSLAAADAYWQTRFGATDEREAREQLRLRRFGQVLIGAAASEREWTAGAALGIADAVQAVRQADLTTSA
jgi:predicted ATPase